MRLPLLPRRARVVLAAGVAAAILAASLAPPPAGGDRLLGPLGLVGADKWAHAAGYALLATAVAYVRLARSRRGVLVAAAVAATFGLAVEGLQRGVPGRTFDLADAAANAAGALLAAGVWRATGVGRRLAGRETPADA